MSRETRLALAQPLVRRGLWWAWLGGGLVWSAVVEAPSAIDEAIGLAGPAVPAMLGWLTLGTGMLGHRFRASPRAGLLAALGPLVVSGFAPTPVVVAAALILAGLSGGWVVGGVARHAQAGRGGSAAAGLAVVAAAGGVVLIPLSSLWLGALAVFVIMSGWPRSAAGAGMSAWSASILDGQAVLVARAIDFSFGNRRVVDGLSVALRSGELVALVGPNGSGKSTLLRLLSGHLLPDGGVLAMDGNDVLGASPEELVRLGVSLASGSRPVFPDLTVEQNLQLGAWVCEGGRQSRQELARAALDRFAELAGRASDAAGTLSGGEQRLLALAASLLARPRVLLADEVTLGLSPRARAAALHILRAAADAGAAVFVVDHELRDLVPLTDRVLVMDNGRLTETTEPLVAAARFIPGTKPL